MMEKAIEMLEGQLNQASTERDSFRQALTIRKKTMVRTQSTVRSAKSFIKHCQRIGVSSRDAKELYEVALQRHLEHDERRVMLKQLLAERTEKVWVLTKAIAKLRG